jgi:hypothetical protein
MEGLTPLELRVLRALHNGEPASEGFLELVAGEPVHASLTRLARAGLVAEVAPGASWCINDSGLAALEHGGAS